MAFLAAVVGLVFLLKTIFGDIPLLFSLTLFSASLIAIAWFGILLLVNILICEIGIDDKYIWDISMFLDNPAVPLDQIQKVELVGTKLIFSFRQPATPDKEYIYPLQTHYYEYETITEFVTDLRGIIPNAMIGPRLEAFMKNHPLKR